MFCSFTIFTMAQNLSLVLLVANNLHQNVTLSDISEFIQAKNHFLVNIAIMQEDRKNIWRHILLKFIKKILNLYKFNKFWSILKYLFCSFPNLAENLSLVHIVTNNLHQMLMLSDMSESIQEKNHILVTIASMQQIKKFY